MNIPHFCRNSSTVFVQNILFEKKQRVKRPLSLFYSLLPLNCPLTVSETSSGFKTLNWLGVMWK